MTTFRLKFQRVICNWKSDEHNNTGSLWGVRKKKPQAWPELRPLVAVPTTEVQTTTTSIAPGQGPRRSNRPSKAPLPYINKARENEDCGSSLRLSEELQRGKTFCVGNQQKTENPMVHCQARSLKLWELWTATKGTHSTETPPLQLHPERSQRKTPLAGPNPDVDTLFHFWTQRIDQKETKL